ncbi:DUF4386 domain-containing protein [Reinekea sp.]|uniref:DUF4386 domain-containing protein n=1 Tax=Reinekea sp. TaxID=1970455 RepID=UPI002A828D74|nr:DUF4386 domain-containing protein [Reinekea sp.]
MMTQTANPTTLARRAGWLYLLLVPLGVYALLYIPELIWVPGNPAQTVSRLGQHESAFRWSILAAFAIQITQLFVALALYDLFKAVNKRMAVLMVLFTLAAMPIAMFNELFHVAALYLGAGQLASTETAQQVALLFQLHADGIMIAHVFWGFWLFPMGYLSAKSGFVPRPIGWLLMLASLAYVMDSILWFGAPDLSVGFAEYIGWAEIFLPLWLVTRGVKNHPVAMGTPSRELSRA